MRTAVSCGRSPGVSRSPLTDSCAVPVSGLWNVLGWVTRTRLTRLTLHLCPQQVAGTGVFEDGEAFPFPILTVPGPSAMPGTCLLSE